ncbi:uncharacterized protein LOC113343709 [Papaver somniferum]|uniref:uncharacterized protein LOC113343709 n=1 Tax=Papaver somniferum TaxID=3469 RepID=UPI000E6FD6C1|nr:uncharacterized protein LOC113343709 [Papaver somniferum]XP_026443627.1 uncharacterized protein LOC113343709 [Papaver somniferum]
MSRETDARVAALRTIGRPISLETLPITLLPILTLNYRSDIATNGDLAGFAASPHRQKSMPEGVDRLMLDDDPLGKGSNKRALHTNDPYWDRVLLLFRGQILHGSFPHPQFPAEPYPFWVINDDRVKPQGEPTKSASISKNRSAGTRVEEDQGKKFPRREDEDVGGYDTVGGEGLVPRRNPPRGKVAAKVVVLKSSDIVIDIPDQEDEDDIFGDEQLFDEDAGGQKEGEVPAETVIVTPIMQSGAQGPTRTSLQKLPQKDVGSPSGVLTSFTISGPMCDSLGALHSEEFGSYTDEQMIAAVPLYHDIAPVFDNLALNRSRLEAALRRQEIRKLEAALQQEKKRSRDLEIKLADAQAEQGRAKDLERYVHNLGKEVEQWKKAEGETNVNIQAAESRSEQLSQQIVDEKNAHQSELAEEIKAGVNEYIAQKRCEVAQRKGGAGVVPPRS